MQVSVGRQHNGYILPAVSDTELGPSTSTEHIAGAVSACGIPYADASVQAPRFSVLIEDDDRESKIAI